MRLLFTSVSVIAAAVSAAAAEWKNWEGGVVAHPVALVTPTSEDEIVQIVNAVSTQNLTLKLVGAGHSWSPIAAPDGGGALMSLDSYNSVVSVDREKMQITVQGGMRLYELNEILDEFGWALPQLGAVSVQSVAGATQTATHGTGRELGTISEAIVSLSLIAANGTVITASPEVNPELFAAARVGLGALGVVSTLTFQAVPKYYLERSLVVNYDVEELLEKVPALYEQFPRMQFVVQPFRQLSGMVIAYTEIDEAVVQNIRRCRPEEEEEEEEVQKVLNGTAGEAEEEDDPMELAAEALAQELARNLTLERRAERRKEWAVLSDTRISRVYRSTCADASFKAMSSARAGSSKFTEMELFFPVEKSLDAFKEFIQRIWSLSDLHRNYVRVQVMMRYVSADPVSYMSPEYERTTGVISLIVSGTRAGPGDLREFQLWSAVLQSIGEKYGARFHWGKKYIISPYTKFYLSLVYPKLDEFLQIREDMDPKGIFLNQHLKEMFLL
uniref:FAD-binding PCMH-type domain-containing protein n=1 Tax=Chromera velia CCMP2878 TaxID=1169474 RepID=A0A0G4F778_9ALVE|mmetsp:Transcript_44325/g.87508  ORF Transcript_44325/g.87508 Transcript_44325/m.87508 type:complete len:500 (+) Transcript_44325:85-1584(+)|eukprot:Cvel_2904.t1-p1 / transcript=Cvel_2904.t1 / gene=Cvel_2904 / organism=Chromera_velia_CCMP2878 / gene_product=L-gulono-1,4-lactone dehydrogenase, putative / transcript_product=L-gulono-1,4-lactone dehydrogenase, putative / location=Cvel_scaffold115:9683-11179(-) / protein_length=499 / sequence_SO=supercontig / SO=protein_coding / is_pseudo=false